MPDRWIETNPPSAPVLRRFLGGTTAGLLATVPMSLGMLAMHRLLPARERYPLPPEEVTEELADKANVRQDLNELELDVLTVATHFGYGALMGALFSMLTWKMPLPRLVLGPIYALLVWAGSYLGWLPAFSILTPATRHPPRRNALMIASHLIWGTASGWLIQRFERPGSGW